MLTKLWHLLPVLLVNIGYSQPLLPEHFKKIGSTNIDGLPDAGLFGTSVAPIGDLNGDGFTDIAVGSRDDGGSYYGGLRLIFLDGNNDVKSFAKIPSLGPPASVFGYAVRSIGDLDGDGVGDLAVGAPYDGDGGHQYGAVYILFMNTDATVKSSQKISSLHGGFTETLTTLSSFGTAIANLGDLDNDGNVDIAVGAYRDNGGSEKTGSVYVLFLNQNGTVKNSTKISGNMGGLTSFLSFEGYFGVSAAGIGDLDKDGITDMAVGSHRWDEGATDAGSLWILFMNSNGTVKSHYRIDNSSGDIPEHLSSATLFGTSVDYANDIDGDGVGDILVGALGDDDQGSNSGAIWVLLMNENGTVGNAYKVNGVQGNTDITLGAGDYFGTSVAYLGMKDGLLNLAIGAMRADEGGIDRGVVWIPGTFVCPDLSADAGTDQTFCDGRTIINLDAVPVDKGFGRWSKLEADGNVEDQYSPQSTVSGLGAGEHNFVWTVTYSQNCPSETDEVKVIIEPELSAGEDLFLCEGGTTAMNGSEVGSGNGLWEIVSGEGTFLDPSDPHTNIEVHHDATLRWTIQSSYCPESSDEVNISVWDVEPDAGPDQILCDERRETYLHALAPEKGTGQWSLVSSDAVVGDLHAPQTSVSNLSPGEHIIAWTVSLTACPTKVDTVKIFKEQPAVAGPDTVLCEGRTALLNASDPGQGTGLWEVIKGQATFTDANHPRTEAFFHTDSVTLKWTLQSQYCSGVSDEMQVRIWEIDESKFYNVITPGDGVEMNEVWLVQNLEDLPGQKELRIFNRWGNLVYAAENYQNDWDAAGLSAGEYYYHMSLSSCAKEVKGWIHVIK